MLTRALEDAGEVSEREHLYLLAVHLMQLLPDNSHAIHALAWNLIAQRRFDEAENTLKTVLEIEPAHPLRAHPSTAQASCALPRARAAPPTSRDRSLLIQGPPGWARRDASPIDRGVPAGWGCGPSCSCPSLRGPV